MPSLDIADTTFESLVQDVPEGMRATARVLGAFERGRGMKEPGDLFRAVLLYCGRDQSLRDVAANFAQTGNRVSDEAVRKRLCKCESWLRHLLESMLAREPGTKANGFRMILIDGTTIQAPGARSSDYRVHLGWNWSDQRLVYSKITDTKTPESLELYEWQSGDLAIADAAYATARQLTLVVEKGADYVVRCAASNIRLFDDNGVKLDVVAELKRQKKVSKVSLGVSVKSGKSEHRALLHAFRLPADAAAQARERLRKRSIRKGSKTKEKTMYLAQWTLILTSLESRRISAEDVAQLYRSRWQIEMVIKRMKSLVKIGALRAKRGSRLAQVYLLGKLIYTLMIEKRATYLATDRTVDWRLWKLIHEQFLPHITLVHYHRADCCDQTLKMMKERTRKRQRLRDRMFPIVKKLQYNLYQLKELYP